MWFVTRVAVSLSDTSILKYGFCRYADHRTIYVRSRRAEKRVLRSVQTFPEKKLRLTLNARKISCAPVQERLFLGYQLQAEGRFSLALASLTRLRKLVQHLTMRNRGRDLNLVIQDLTVNV